MACALSWWSHAWAPSLYLSGGAPPGQSLYLVSRAVGLLALVLLSAQMLGGLHRDSIHQRLGRITLIALLLHPLLFLSGVWLRTGAVRLDLLFPVFGHGYYHDSIALGGVALGLLIVTIAAVLKRESIGAVWRKLHWLSAPALMLVLIHALRIGTDSRQFGVLAGLGLVGIAIVASIRRAQRRRTDTRVSSGS